MVVKMAFKGEVSEKGIIVKLKMFMQEKKVTKVKMIMLR